MALTTRQKLFFFSGLNIAIYGLVLTIFGVWLLDGTFHGASGAPMWCGILLIMCGVGDIIISIDSDSKDNVGGMSVGSLFANMIAMLVGILTIVFATWGAWDALLSEGIRYNDTEADIEIYITVCLLGGFSMILALLALMYDCCCGMNGLDLFNMNVEQPQLPGGAQYPYPANYR